MRKIYLALAVLTAIGLSACGSSNQSSTPTKEAAAAVQTTEAPKPLDLSGTWEAVGDDGETKFVAVVKNNAIEMNLVAPDMKALYWKGDFNAPVATSDDVTVVSNADTEALAASIMGSQDKTKEFVYKDDQLSFEFQALGVTRTIHLKK